MKAAKILMAGAMVMAFASTAFAQQSVSGTITKIDRINGTVAIQQTESGTVGASAGGATEELKMQDRAVLENFHAGDRVTFSTAETGGIKTITKLQKR